MKKLAAITASVILTTAFATAVSANEDLTPIQLNVDEPIIKAGETVIAPNPIDLLETIYFYDNPNGSPWGAVSPQKIQTTGQTINGWIEVYTWLGKAWVYLPNHVLSYN